MSFRLRNQRDPQQTLRLNILTWYGILEMAEAHGWNPMGAVLPEWSEPGLAWPAYDFEDPEINYWDERLVLLEDALNLADALENAYQAYEPIHLPSLRYYAVFNGNSELDRAYIGLGALERTIQFCQLGAFYIEKI